MFCGVNTELCARTCLRWVGEVSPCWEEVPPKTSCVSGEVKWCLSRLLAKAFGEGSFSAHLCMRVRELSVIFIFSVLKMDERGHTQQINFRYRRARAPAMFLLLQVLPQIPLSVTGVLLYSSLAFCRLSSTLIELQKEEEGFLLTAEVVQHPDWCQLSLQIKSYKFRYFRTYGIQAYVQRMHLTRHINVYSS